MNREDRIKALAQTGQIMQEASAARENAIQQAGRDNPWFIPEHCLLAISNLTRHLLEESALQQWASTYPPIQHVRRVGVVAAGNIPLVGFHDMLCILVSGHHLQLKLSEKDSALISFVLNTIKEVSEELFEQVTVTGRLQDFEAVIATGSNNTARYFTYYFGKYPHIIRHNRTSLAVLTGKETPEELRGLGHDIFDFFGLGCRNVSHLLVPEGYDLKVLLQALEDFADIALHHKYRHNFDYQRTIYLMNRIPYLPADHINIIESRELHSPVACLHYHYYRSEGEVRDYLEQNKDYIQCVVGNAAGANIPFGKSQELGLYDYADHIDTMQFLASLP